MSPIEQTPHEELADIVGKAEHEIHYMHTCIADDLTSIVDFWIGTSLRADWRRVPGQLIFNLYEDPILVTGGPGYRVGRTKKIMKDLKASKKYLLRSDKLMIKDPKRSADDRNYASKRLSDLNCVASIYLRHMDVQVSNDAFVKLIDHLLTIYSVATSSQERSGKFHAYRTAVALRVVFERFSSIPVTTGKDENLNPTGPFCRCLEEVFGHLSIEAGFFHYAGIASKLEDGDALLVEMRDALMKLGA